MKYTLLLGESANVRPGSFRMSLSIVYTGMITDNKYSNAVTWDYGYHSAAYNLFLSLDHKEVVIPKGKLIIESVSENEFIFIYKE
jgi:hypothetical protein